MNYPEVESTVQYSTVQYSTVQCKKRDGGKGRREGKKGTRLGFLLGCLDELCPEPLFSHP